MKKMNPVLYFEMPAGIPGVGKYASFIDSEGNRVSMLQPAM